MNKFFQKTLMMLAAVMYCAVIVTVQTSCSSDNDDNPDGMHSDYIGKRDQYSKETCQEILDFVARYVKY